MNSERTNKQRVKTSGCKSKVCDNDEENDNFSCCSTHNKFDSQLYTERQLKLRPLHLTRHTKTIYYVYSPAVLNICPLRGIHFNS